MQCAMDDVELCRKCGGALKAGSDHCAHGCDGAGDSAAEQARIAKIAFKGVKMITDIQKILTRYLKSDGETRRSTLGEILGLTDGPAWREIEALLRPEEKMS